MSIKEKVRIAVAEKTGGRFSAVDLAHDIGVPTKYGNASYEVCPSVTKEDHRSWPLLVLEPTNPPLQPGGG